MTKQATYQKDHPKVLDNLSDRDVARLLMVVLVVLHRFLIHWF